MMPPHEHYMARAIEIARCGEPYAHPNPLVGSVIVDPSGRILAEGYHRRCGEAHAEVNAVAMLDRLYPDIDPHGLTVYVSLEPCAHFGRTPPCAAMLARRGFGTVVIGTLDPFAKVNGKGAAMLREAGAKVIVGVLEEECRKLNRRFFIAHTLRRPYIMLKWAQSADGFIDARRTPGHPGPFAFSSGIGRALVHRLRAGFDAIAVGAGTVRADRPRLDTRLWAGPSPRPVIFGNEKSLLGTTFAPCEPESRNTESHDTESLTPEAHRKAILIPGARTPEALREAMASLYGDGITSLLVEGGSRLLQSFIDAGLWDDIRVETSPVVLGASGSVRAPRLPSSAILTSTATLTGATPLLSNQITTFTRPADP